MGAAAAVVHVSHQNAGADDKALEEEEVDGDDALACQNHQDVPRDS